MSRIPPLPSDEWPASMRDAIAALTPPEPRHPFPNREGRPKGRNALGTFAHHPALTRAFHAFNGHVLFATTITPRQRELLVLRVASLRQCAYEWAQHVVLAADVGLRADEIEAVRVGPDAPGWNALDRALLSAADSLLADADVSDETWAALASELDTQQLMDVIFTVGAYDLIAMAFKSFGVELDDDLSQSASSGGLGRDDASSSGGLERDDHLRKRPSP
jgi:alkylhydroperoxidase family enzyme